MHAIVHSADIQDRDGGALLMASLFGAFPFLIKLYADGGYQGPEFQSAMKRILARVTVEIVKRSDQATGFVALPKRWIVERTLAWLGRCRTGQGLGMPQQQGARLSAPGLHPPHAAKTMQSRMMFSDRLLGRHFVALDINVAKRFQERVYLLFKDGLLFNDGRINLRRHLFS